MTFIMGSRPEWCISSMIYSEDTPFWSETKHVEKSFYHYGECSGYRQKWVKYYIESRYALLRNFKELGLCNNPSFERIKVCNTYSKNQDM